MSAPTTTPAAAQVDNADKPARLYSPSNSTEGMAFMAEFCDACEHDRTWREEERDSCMILCRALACRGVSDPEYPVEWRYGDDGEPTCTAFVHEAVRDQARERGEPDPVPVAPGQLRLL